MRRLPPLTTQRPNEATAALNELREQLSELQRQQQAEIAAQSSSPSGSPTAPKKAKSVLARRLLEHHRLRVMQQREEEESVKKERMKSFNAAMRHEAQARIDRVVMRREVVQGLSEDVRVRTVATADAFEQDEESLRRATRHAADRAASGALKEQLGTMRKLLAELQPRVVARASAATSEGTTTDGVFALSSTTAVATHRQTVDRRYWPSDIDPDALHAKAESRLRRQEDNEGHRTRVTALQVSGTVPLDDCIRGGEFYRENAEANQRAKLGERQAAGIERDETLILTQGGGDSLVTAKEREQLAAFAQRQRFLSGLQQQRAQVSQYRRRIEQLERQAEADDAALAQATHDVASEAAAGVIADAQRDVAAVKIQAQARAQSGRRMVDARRCEITAARSREADDELPTPAEDCSGPLGAVDDAPSDTVSDHGSEESSRLGGTTRSATTRHCGADVELLIAQRDALERTVDAQDPPSAADVAALEAVQAKLVAVLHRELYDAETGLRRTEAECATERRRHSAATSIQALSRGRHGRRLAAARRSERAILRDELATRVQAAARAALGARLSALRTTMLRHARAAAPSPDAYATPIQAAFKGMRVRATTVRPRDATSAARRAVLLEESAASIQRAARRRIAHAALSRRIGDKQAALRTVQQTEAAVLIQAQARRRAAQRMTADIAQRRREGIARDLAASDAEFADDAELQEELRRAAA